MFFMQTANASSDGKLLHELTKAVDACRVNYVKYLRPINEASARDDFLKDARLKCPRYKYDKLNEKALGRKRAHIVELINEIKMRKDLSDDLRNTFLKDLGQSWYYTELISAAHDYNMGVEKANAQKRFKRASDAALGRMHEDTFWSLLRERIASIDAKKLNADDYVIYHEMLALIGVMGRNRKRHYAPNRSLIKKFRQRIHDLLDGIARYIPEDRDSFTPQDGADIIIEIIKKELKIPYVAEVDENVLTASVRSSEQKIIMPGGRKGLYSRIELEKLIVHELGVHTIRATSAEVDNLPVSAFSKNGAYSRLTEEGLAKVCEQAIDGKYDDICTVRYLAIGFAQVCKKNFRQSYEILWRMEHLTSGRNKEDCFSIIQRAFRGTGVLPINTDLIYRRGYVLVWRYIEDHINDPSLIKTLFLSGKNDFLEQKRNTLLRMMREDGLID